MISIFIAGGVSLLVAGVRHADPHARCSRPAGSANRSARTARRFHVVKAGTPTMGGIAIIVAATIGYLLGHVGTSTRFTIGGGLALGATILAGGIGFADDWLKVRRRRSLGLNKRAKLVLQVVLGVGFALAALALGARQHDCSRSPATTCPASRSGRSDGSSGRPSS